MSDFIERHPDVMVFGGPFDAFPETDLPDWFPLEYGSWSLGDQERPVMIGEEFINGTDMVFHKSQLESLGGFKCSLGMSGEQISYGEETRLQVDIAARGLPVYYLPGMRVDHLVPKYKTNLKWLLSSAFASGRCSAETLNRQRTFGAHLYGLLLVLQKWLCFCLLRASHLSRGLCIIL